MDTFSRPYVHYSRCGNEQEQKRGQVIVALAHSGGLDNATVCWPPVSEDFSGAGDHQSPVSSSPVPRSGGRGRRSHRFADPFAGIHETKKKKIMTGQQSRGWGPKDGPSTHHRPEPARWIGGEHTVWTKGPPPPPLAPTNLA